MDSDLQESLSAAVLTQDWFMYSWFSSALP